MFSYQHRYHAGNFADLHKHICLAAIIKYLQKKPGAVFYLDAFAGEGLYDTLSIESQKNQEYLSGYGLLNTKNILSKNNNLFAYLLSLTKNNIIPGSPMVIASLLRQNDRAVFIDNHPEAYKYLSENFKYDKNIKTYKRDSYEAVNALVPYQESRGVIFIDPSYEVKDEYKNIVNLISSSYKKNATGIYIIWYPILANKNYYKDLLGLLDIINNNKIWHHQYIPNIPKVNMMTEGGKGMIGSGLIVINMPWSVDAEIEECFI